MGGRGNLWQPNWRLTQDIEFSLESLDRTKWLIENYLLVKRQEEFLRREVLHQRIASTSWIEGNPLNYEQVEQVLQGERVDAPAYARKEIINLKVAHDYIDHLSDSGDVEWTERAIRLLHWLIMRDIDDEHLQPGGYRQVQNWIRDASTGQIAYTPPPPFEVPPLMDSFLTWLRTDAETSPPIKAAIAHAHLIAVHPFLDGNGRTARASSLLILQSGGYGFRKLLNQDAYFQRHRDGYFGALRGALGAKFDERADLTPWIEYFLFSLSVQADLVRDRFTALHMIREKVRENLRARGLSVRQSDAMGYLALTGRIATRDYMEICEVSRDTAVRDLAALVDRGMIEPKGVGRGRHYVLHPELQAALDGRSAQPGLSVPGGEGGPSRTS
jgi:Fic family protein